VTFLTVTTCYERADGTTHWERYVTTQPGVSPEAACTAYTTALSEGVEWYHAPPETVGCETLTIMDERDPLLTVESVLTWETDEVVSA